MTGNELDYGPEPRYTHDDEYDARHHGRDREPVVAVFLHDPVDDDDEGARRPADLHS
jgi:hypothetical protein